MPAYLLRDLQRASTGLYIAPNWQTDLSDGRVYLFHESAGVASFDCNDLIWKVVDRVARGRATVHDAVELLQARSLGVLLDLWQRRILRVDDGVNEVATDRSTKPSRYVWFSEYLRTYAGPSNTVQQMLHALATAKVCVIGLGGLGATVALSLAASGVGRLRLIDGDIVEESNLPRQILYTEASIGRKKAYTLRDVILANNAAVRIEAIDGCIGTQEDADAAVDGCDLVVLCADQPRFDLRNWVGKASLGQGVPSIAMAGQWVGPLSVPGQSPCHVCVGRFHGSRIADPAGFVASLQGATPERESFGPRPLILAGFMASTVLRYLTRIDTETPLHRRFRVDVMGRVEEEQIVRYRNCFLCGKT